MSLFRQDSSFTYQSRMIPLLSRQNIHVSLPLVKIYYRVTLDMLWSKAEGAEFGPYNLEIDCTLIYCKALVCESLLIDGIMGDASDMLTSNLTFLSCLPLRNHRAGRYLSNLPSPCTDARFIGIHLGWFRNYLVKDPVENISQFPLAFCSAVLLFAYS